MTTTNEKKIATALFGAFKEPKPAKKPVAKKAAAVRKVRTAVKTARVEQVAKLIADPKLGKLASAAAKKIAAKKADAKPAAKAAPKKAAKTETAGPRGAKAKIIEMIGAKGGVTEPEVCKALGWAAAGATISRAIKLAPFKVTKAKDEDGRTRYSRA